MISAAVGVNSSLLIEPAQTLTFPLDKLDPNNSYACVSLTNISSHKHVIFKVRTTCAEMFGVKPTQGIIEPGGNVTIVINMIAATCTRLLSLTNAERDKIAECFLIQSVDKTDDMRGFSPAAMGTFWQRIPKEVVTNKKLTCRYVRKPTSLVHFPSKQPLASSPSPSVESSDFDINGRRNLPSTTTSSDLELYKNQKKSSNQEEIVNPVAKKGLGIIRSNSHENSIGVDEPLANDVDEDFCEYQIIPRDILTFSLKQMDAFAGESHFTLTNLANYSGMAFKIKVTNHNGYYVKPSRGLIGGNGTQRIDVYMNHQDHPNPEQRDRFLIEIVFVNSRMYQELSTLDEDQQKQELAAVWANSPIKKTVLACRFHEVSTLAEGKNVIRRNEPCTNQLPLARRTPSDWVSADRMSYITGGAPPSGNQRPPLGQRQYRGNIEEVCL